jgi:hypothetical protein
LAVEVDRIFTATTVPTGNARAPAKSNDPSLSEDVVLYAEDTVEEDSDTAEEEEEDDEEEEEGVDSSSDVESATLL